MTAIRIVSLCASVAAITLSVVAIHWARQAARAVRRTREK